MLPHLKYGCSLRILLLGYGVFRLFLGASRLLGMFSLSTGFLILVTSNPVT